MHLHLCGVVRLLGEFLPRINILLRGLRLLDLEQCPDIELEMLEVTKLPYFCSFCNSVMNVLTIFRSWFGRMMTWLSRTITGSK